MKNTNRKCTLKTTKKKMKKPPMAVKILTKANTNYGKLTKANMI